MALRMASRPCSGRLAAPSHFGPPTAPRNTAWDGEAGVAGGDRAGARPWRRSPRRRDQPYSAKAQVAVEAVARRPLQHPSRGDRHLGPDAVAGKQHDVERHSFNFRSSPRMRGPRLDTLDPALSFASQAWVPACEGDERGFSPPAPRRPRPRRCGSGGSRACRRLPAGRRGRRDRRRTPPRGCRTAVRCASRSTVTSCSGRAIEQPRASRLVDHHRARAHSSARWSGRCRPPRSETTARKP